MCQYSIASLWTHASCVVKLLVRCLLTTALLLHIAACGDGDTESGLPNTGLFPSGNNNSTGTGTGIGTAWQGTWARQNVLAECSDATTLLQRFYAPSLHYTYPEGNIIGLRYSKCIDWPAEYWEERNSLQWLDAAYTAEQQGTVRALADSIYTAEPLAPRYGDFTVLDRHHYRFDPNDTEAESIVIRRVSDRLLVNSIWLINDAAQTAKQYPGCTHIQWKESPGSGRVEIDHINAKIPLPDATGEMRYLKLSIPLFGVTDLQVGAELTYGFFPEAILYNDTGLKQETHGNVRLSIDRVTRTELQLTAKWIIDDTFTRTAQGIVYLNPEQWLPSPYRRDGTYQFDNFVNSDRDGDGYEDGFDVFPDNVEEWLDTDSDGVGDRQDNDDDNDNVPDNDDPYPTVPHYGNDIDGDGRQDQVDPDDDGDGVSDWEDALPKDPTEQIDTDGDGIGNNRDSDDDGDGIPDSEDGTPLDPRCGTASDSTDGACHIDVLVDADLFAQFGDYVLIGRRGFNAVFPIHLASGNMQPAISLENYSLPGTELTAMYFAHGHQRLYLGFSSGVITYLEPQSFQSKYFHAMPSSVKKIADAGNYLYVEPRYGDSSRIDINGVLAHTGDFIFDTSGDPVWWDAQSHLVFLDNVRIESFIIDQNTGALVLNEAYPRNVYQRNTLPLTITPDGNTVITGSGTSYTTDTLAFKEKLFINDVIDFQWHNNNALITLEAQGDASLIRRYTPQFDETEQVIFSGKPLKLFEQNNQHYLLTLNNSQYQITRYTPTGDTDGDGILNRQDDFPHNPAASVDSDRDGYPDQWNPGYSDTANTTLTLDAYPADPACHTLAEGDGTRCYYDTALLAQPPHTIVADNSGIAYLFYRDHPLVYRWHLATADYIEPLRVSDTSAAAVLYPQMMAYSPDNGPDNGRLYFAYNNGRISSIDVGLSAGNENTFAVHSTEVMSLLNAGPYIVSTEQLNGRQFYRDVNGRDMNVVGGSQIAEHNTWGSLYNRHYSLRQRNFPFDDRIFYDEWLITNGTAEFIRLILSEEAPLDSPILISPDNETVIVGSGEYFDAGTLERQGTITTPFTHGTYLPNGNLAAVSNTDNGSRLTIYQNKLPLAPTVDITGHPLQIFSVNEVIYVFTHSDEAGVKVTSVPAR